MRRGLLVILLFVLVFSPAYGGDYIRLNLDQVDPGQTQDFPFMIERTCPDPAKIMGASNGFNVWATGAATWTFVDDLNNATRDGFYADPATNTWWNFGGLLFTDYISGSGMTSGSFLTGGAGFMAGGMPVISEQEYFSIRLTLGDGAGQICIDSAFIPPAGAWKFSGLTCGLGGDPDRPLFLDKSGSDANHPICIPVGTPCPSPLINVVPAGDQLTGTHCAGLSFTFGADPGAGETIAGWMVLSGPGMIGADGYYQVDPMATGTYPVIIQVENSCGGLDEYEFDLVFTNVDPVFTNAGGEDASIVAGQLYSYDFDADDADGCDDLVFSINSVTPTPTNAPTMNAASGLLEWQTALLDTGATYDFEIQVVDIEPTKGAVTYQFSVTVLEPVCTDPTFTATPADDELSGSHCGVQFQFEVDPGMYGENPATIEVWGVLGFGSINSSGLYTASSPDAGVHFVEIYVTNSCGAMEWYQFSLYLTTEDPYFTNAASAPTQVQAGELYTYDFDADDPDDCDTPLFYIGTVTPSVINAPTINENTGLFEWLSDVSELGMTAEIQIILIDAGADKANVDTIITIEVMGEVVCTDPIINVTPVDDELIGSHCGVQFQFGADPGMFGVDPATITGWSVTAGIGSITNAGLYSASSATEGMHSVTIQVANNCGGTGDYTFDLSLLSANPAFTNAGSAPDTITAGGFYSFDFDGIDPDPCDTPTFGLGSVVPTPTFAPDINAASGLFQWQTNVADAGKKFSFQIWLFDAGAAKANVEFVLEVDVLTVEEKPEIELDPGYFYFTKRVDDPDPAGKEMDILNIGGGTLDWELANDSTWLVPSATAGTAPSTVTLNIAAGGRPVGYYRDTIFVTAAAAINSPQFAIVDLEITPMPAPCVELSQDFFTFTGYECGPNPSPQYFDVINCGEVPIAWEIQPVGLLPAGGVSFDPMSGSDDATVEISVDIDCLAPGTYYDSACVVLVGKIPPPCKVCLLIEVVIEEEPSLDIAGTVYEEGSGTPIGGAVVELYDMFPMSMIAMTTSAGDGSFNFGPYSGSYTVRAYKTGYYQNFEHITAPDEDVELYLTPTQSPVPTFEWVNLYCDYATFQDYPILPGDVVEAYDPTGVLCGQYFVTTEGMYGFMPVYRDDILTTPGIDEGCDPGDAITVKLNGFDMTGYLDSPAIWTTNGASIEACFDGYIEKVICIHLDEGWNLISWNVDTDVDDIEILLADIMHLVDVVLSFEQGGLTYDPFLTEFSTLDYADHFHGYWVKVSDSTTICFTGMPADPCTPIPLERGWNLASYLPTVPDSTPDALASIYGDLIFALGYYDQVGLTWDPMNPDPSNLRYMAPGYGYWLKVTNDVDLIYCGLPVAAPALVAHSTFPKANTLSHITPTSRWVDLYGANVTVDGYPIASGTVVEAVSEYGVVCGAFAVNATGKLGFMPVYGDDATTKSISEGPKAHESFYLVVDGVETKEMFTWTSHADRIEVGALNSVGGRTVTVPKAYGLHQNYPNPFNPQTTIAYDLGTEAYVNLTVFNILGEAVKVLVDGYQSAGSGHQVVWDGTDQNGLVVSSGIYFYKLSAGNFTETRKMMLMK